MPGNLIPASPNLFHNPITSGLNSTKNCASPLLNNTANFAAQGFLGAANFNGFRGSKQ